MVLLASSFDQSKYLRASDLDGEEEARFKIRAVTEETLGTDREHKLVIWFSNDKRGYVTNRTALRVLAPAFGDDTSLWAGKIIILYRTTTEMAGKTLPCLRVRIPAPKAAASAQAATPAAVPETKPVSKPSSLRDELNDEIGF